MTPRPHLVTRLEQAPRAVRSAFMFRAFVTPAALIALCDRPGLIPVTAPRPPQASPGASL